MKRNDTAASLLITPTTQGILRACQSAWRMSLTHAKCGKKGRFKNRLCRYPPAKISALLKKTRGHQHEFFDCRSAHRLPGLVKALREQECPIPFEILIVDNNSTDETQAVLDQLSLEDGPPLRFVKETQQGIVFARNRALEESLGNAYMAFLDDDELPPPGMLKAAIDALEREGSFLTKNFPVLASTDWYLVFDLRRRNST